MRWEGAEPPRFDERDAALVAEWRELFDARPGVRVGDVVLCSDGRFTRVTHVWGDEPEDTVQTLDGFGLGGSFAFGGMRPGYLVPWTGAGCSYSGGLWTGYRQEELTDTGETLEASAWIFHHNLAGAGRGVDFTMPFRVFRADSMPRGSGERGR
jgi:hypothetical protein